MPEIKDKIVVQSREDSSSEEAEHLYEVENTAPRVLQKSARLERTEERIC